MLKGTVFQMLSNSILSTSQMNIADICTLTLRDTNTITVTGPHPAGPAQYLKPSWMIWQEVISNLRLSLWIHYQQETLLFHYLELNSLPTSITTLLTNFPASLHGPIPLVPKLPMRMIALQNHERAARLYLHLHESCGPT
jgi:hypothetical protein